MWRVYSPSNRSGVPSCQCSRIARMASTHSRIWATGLPHRDPNRFSMWGFTWVPNPSPKRPSLSFWRSHAVCARCIGDRGNAIATFV